MLRFKTPLLAAALLLLSTPSFADEFRCVYKDELGVLRETDSPRKVPPRLRKQSRCFKLEKQQNLAAPDEVSLKGATGKERITSAVGPVELRWPRSVQSIIGKTPVRAMVDAGRMVGRALKRPGFPSKLSRLRLEWQVVFLDAELSTAEVPAYLVSNCHPAWMTPPSNIYVVVQRVAAGCGSNSRVSRSEADAKMAEVLAHEMGHVIEFHLLGEQMRGDRARSEGFATWFESFASDFSSLIPKGAVRAEHFRWAESSYRRQPNRFTFRGTAEDYARASLTFHAVVEERGIRGLMEVYEAMQQKKIPLRKAIEEVTYWSEQELHERERKVLR